MRRPTPIQFQDHDNEKQRLEKLRRLASQVGDALAREFDPSSLEGSISALDTRVTSLESTVSSIVAGSGFVRSVVAGNYIDVDATDPANPAVSVSQSLVNAISSITRDHHSLLNLTDGNDHTQYPLKAGDETIAGQWDFSQQIRGPAGNFSVPTHTFTGEPTTGAYLIGAGNYGITLAGALHWDLNNVRVAQPVGLIATAYNGVFIQNPDYPNAGIDMTTITGSSPLTNGIGNQIAFWEVGTGGSFTDRSYGFRIRHTGEVSAEGNLDWYRHENDTVGVLFLRMTRDSSQIQFADGSEGSPAITNIGDTDTGMTFPAANEITLSAGGLARMRLNTTLWRISVQGQFTDGSAGTPSIAFTSDTNKGFYHVGSNQIGVSTNGTLRMTIATTTLTSTLLNLGPNGTAGGPTYSASADPNTGDYSVGADIWGVSAGGTLRAQWSITAYSMPADNYELQLGASNDLRLLHDGTNSLIRNDTGALRLQIGTTVALEAAATTGNLSSARDATWSGDHLFTNGFGISNAQPEAFWIETDAAADNGVWGALVAGTSFRLSAFSDNLGTEVPALTFARSGTTLGTMTIGGAGYTGLAVSLLTDAVTPLTVNGTNNGAYSLVFDNDSNGTANSCRIVFNSGDASGAFFTAGSGRTSAVLTGGPTGAQGVIRMLGAYPLILGTNNTAYFQIPADGGMAIVDGITAPATLSGWAKIYVDSADGDLKIKFGDGTVKTIVTDT